MSSVLIGLRKYSFPAFVKLSARNSTQLLSKKSSHNFQKFLKSNRFGTLLTCSGLAIYYFFSPSAECMPGKSDSPLDDLSSGNFSEIFNKYFGQYSDQINQLGYSGIVGVCSGYAFKRVSKEIAFAIGGVFVFLQGLSYMGYININYGKIEKDVTSRLDQNNDGKLTAEDVKIAWNNANSVLSSGLSSVSGFASGFAIGFYYG